MTGCAEALRRVEELLASIEDPVYANILRPEDEIRLRAILYRLGQLREAPDDNECRELLSYAESVVGEIRSRLTSSLGAQRTRREPGPR